MPTNKYFKYQCLIAISMLYITCILTADLVTYKIIRIGPYNGSASLIIFPLVYLLSDMITELYGKKLSRYLVYVALATEFLFDVVFSQIIHLPSPASFAHQAQYDYIFAGLPRVYSGVVVALLVSSLVNIYFMGKWHTRYQQRSYALRSFASSLVGEIIFIVIGYTIWFYGIKSFSQIIELMISSFFSKVIFTLMLLWPIAFIVKLIKNKQYDFSLT